MHDGLGVLSREVGHHNGCPVNFADECLVLQRGELAWNGPAAEVEGELLRHYLGDAMVTMD